MMNTAAVPQPLFDVTSNVIADEVQDTVNAKELYAFLDVKEQYSDWIQRSLAKAKRRKGKDFIVLQVSQVKPKGGRPSTEYYLTLSCCEHLGMMSDRVKGVQIREYFIGLKNAYMQKLQADRESQGSGSWFQKLLRDTPGKFEAKFQGEIAAHINALNEKTRQGVPKLPSDVGSGKVAGAVPNRIREAYLATLGSEVYTEAQRRRKATGAPATQQFVQDMPLDMMRGLMYGLAVAARSEQHYQDMFDAATKNDQLSMPHRWPMLSEDHGTLS